MKILLTGANGFVGQAAKARFEAAGMTVVAATRAAQPGAVAVGEIDGSTDWTAALAGCDVVVHAAARVHQMSETGAAAEDLYRRTNVEGTRNLARQAAEAGVKRFVFLSSIKAMGEGGHFAEAMPCRPEDAYGRSKLEAEAGLKAVAAETGLDVVILRLPLIYGPGVRANFLKLFDLVARGVPIPLGSVRNARSLLFLRNLADLLAVCATHPAAAGRTYLPSDGSPVSTPELIGAIAAALGKPARLIPVPVFLMRGAATLLGKRDAADRLFGSLTVDSAPIAAELGWTPPFSLKQGLAETAGWYRRR